jgi:fructose-1,6-bisphosphatase
VLLTDVGPILVCGVRPVRPGRLSCPPADQVLQPGREQVAGGYCLYSSACLLVLSLGRGTGTHVFTLDPSRGEFTLTNRALTVPPRGEVKAALPAPSPLPARRSSKPWLPVSGRSYSLNEARYNDWPGGLQRYITDLKRGRGRAGVPYDLVYVCSLVADVHWVLIHGGMASNPRSHLRLVYEGKSRPTALLVSRCLTGREVVRPGNPMSLVVEEAGGRASTGTERILDVQPDKVRYTQIRRSALGTAHMYYRSRLSRCICACRSSWGVARTLMSWRATAMSSSWRIPVMRSKRRPSWRRQLPES